MTGKVCVIVAAKNAEATVATAISSALREPEVAEIILVDDASTDATSAAARRSGAGSDRLTIVRCERNVGPAEARNLAIERSSAPYIAILDADDFFLSGRFAAMLPGDDWDLVADNIVFLAESEPLDTANIAVPAFRPNPRFLDLAEFVAGNVSSPDRPRGELGFLKPVIRRDFLERTGLRYESTLRLGEDYDLYARALLAGARFKIIESCGYGAVVRADSLSGRHSTRDLGRLLDCDLTLLVASDLPATARVQLLRHARQVSGNYQLRRFLDVKAEHGLLRAALYGLAHPSGIPAIAAGIVRDKLARGRGVPAGPRMRYLLPGETAGRHPMSLSTAIKG